VTLTKMLLQKREIYQFGQPAGTRLIYEPVEGGGLERRVELTLVDGDGEYVDSDLNLSLTETEHLACCLLELVRNERKRASEVPTDG